MRYLLDAYARHKFRQKVDVALRKDNSLQLVVGAGGTAYAGWISAEKSEFDIITATNGKECIEKAKDYEWGGAKYNMGNGIVMIGVADLINSLSAIKTLIYEEQKLSWDALLEALDKDFEGCEDIRQLCLSAPKWGNDIKAVDVIATEMFQFLADEVRQYNGRHGRMTCGILPVTAEVPLGGVVGALPSGRKAWTPLADGISPTGGTDVNGPTAVLKSVSKIPHPIYTSGTLLNMKLDPVLIEDDRGKRNLMAFLKTLCDLGNYHIQFNIVSTETLREAQRNPEAHRDLLVRVSGYTAYFVELGKEIQDEIIGRTTQRSFS
jgi:formate C-acetyltransferase